MHEHTRRETKKAMGLDLGDQYSYLIVIDEQGKLEAETRVPTRQQALRKVMKRYPAIRVAIEAGTHSPWVARLLRSWGHEVFIANGRKLRLIYENKKKSDRMDAEYLARLARLDPQLLSPIEAKSESQQQDYQVLKLRDQLVRNRSSQIVQVRSLLKNLGIRLPKCSAAAFAGKVAEYLPADQCQRYQPSLLLIEQMSQQIRHYDRQIEDLCQHKYPATEILRQIKGVGPLTALAFVLVIGDPHRFVQPRRVGSYVGLCPARDDSGQSRKQLRISKEGSPFLRRLLVNCAHYILGPFGQPSQLRDQGLRCCERGGKNAKKRAAVAVARKLSVVLLVLWQNGLVYESFPAVSQQAA
jgi:transposase